MSELACELPAGLEVDLGWLLGQAFQAYARGGKRVSAVIPGGQRGYQLLSAAVHQSARSQIEMARQLGVDRTVMVYLVDDMVKEGLVERRPDPVDRRNRLIVATDKGRATLAAVVEQLAQVEQWLLEPLTPAEREAFRDQLRRIVAQFIAHGCTGAPGEDLCKVAEELTS
ncbi:MarR family transcriptional regulator [Streptosporangiaceae bacterium NEAU-GS5]|nr:MarR family transcriptional regulator [Streptosporangiaceae bacterium NEAU-GS5]